MVRATLKLMGVLAVLAGLLGGSQVANAAPAPKKLAGTAWATPTKGGDGYLVVAFGDDGQCLVALAGPDGKFTEKHLGEYETARGGLVKITVDGKTIALKVVSIDDEEMVTENGEGAETTWKAVKLGRSRD